jgi:hypothetical protein
VPQLVQPSNSDVAAVNVENLPAVHSWILQLVFCPTSDHLPVPQSVHPSVPEVAAILVDFCPAGHS